jgi:hypothetical protein
MFMLHSPNLWRFVLALGMAAALAGPSLAEERPERKKDEPGGDLMARLMARFDAWDTNKDGFLDKEELTKALGASRAAAALERYDKDGDGKLSRAEYDAWARRYVKEVMSRFEGVPREGAGREGGGRRRG